MRKGVAGKPVPYSGPAVIGQAIDEPPVPDGPDWIGKPVNDVKTPDLAPDPAEDEDNDIALDDPCGEPEDEQIEEDEE